MQSRGWAGNMIDATRSQTAAATFPTTASDMGLCQFGEHWSRIGARRMSGILSMPGPDEPAGLPLIDSLEEYSTGARHPSHTEKRPSRCRLGHEVLGEDA